MILHARSWGASTAGRTVVCIHGGTQHGGVFEGLATRLAECGYFVVSVDLRGHGASGREPPWNTDTHVSDVLATAGALGIRGAAWIGHSFGGLVAAALAARAPERVRRLVLLDPSLEIPPDRALVSAEVDRLEWSFDSVDGAVNALLSAKSASAVPRATVVAYATEDLQRGRDGRLRFRHCPSAVVAMWSEVTLPAPPIAKLPTLLVRPMTSFIDGRAQDRRYRDALGPLLRLESVPNGHNLLWEAPAETAAVIEGFFAQWPARRAPREAVGAG